MDVPPNEHFSATSSEAPNRLSSTNQPQGHTPTEALAKMAKGKKVTRTAPGSPSARAADLEEVEPADEQPDQKVNVPAAKKKKPRASGGGAALAKPPNKKRNEPEPEVEEEEETEGFPLDDVRAAVKAFRGEHKRKPTAEELAEGMEVDEEVASNALKKLKKEGDKLRNSKKAQRVKGYRKMSKAAGYGYDKDGSTNVISQGIDSLQSLISMSDALRLAQFSPFTPDGVSYADVEFEERMQGILSTLPQSAARQVVANADAVLRFAVNKCVSDTMLSRGAQRVQPSSAVTLLKPYADRMSFSSVLVPPGLVKYAKDEPPPLRKHYAEDEEMGAKGRENKVWTKALAEYKKRVPFVDRGMGLIEVAEGDEEEATLAKHNKATAKKNGTMFRKFTTMIGIEKAKKAKARASAKALSVSA